VSYISTGGGAFLECLEGKTLPAGAALRARACPPAQVDVPRPAYLNARPGQARGPDASLPAITAGDGVGMRGWLMLGLLVAGGAMASGTTGETRHASGEYSYVVAPVPEFVVERGLPAEWPGAAPGADDPRWRYWLHDVQADRRAGRHALHVVHAYEARNASLLAEAARFTIEFSPDFQQLQLHAVRLRRDGQWLDRLDPARISLARREAEFEQNLANGVVTAMIVMEDVRVGDLVQVSYTVLGSNPIMGGQVTDSNGFAWHNPVLDAWLRVLLDPGTVPAVHRQHDAPEPVVTATADATEVVMHAHASPAMVNEGNYPAWFRPYPAGYVSAQRTWADVVAWALPLYPPTDALPEDLLARIEQWRALPDTTARVQAAARAVQDDVRYFGVEMGDNTHQPVAPATTWARRYGDCKDKAYLLVAILGRLGIDAVPALVSSANGRGIAPQPPSASAFDHVIVRVDLADGPLWVDATLSQQGGDIRDEDASALGLALPVAAGVDALETIEPPAGHENGISTLERFVASDAGEVELMVRSVYTGHSADVARQNIAGQRQSDLSRRYADYYRGRYGDLDVASPLALEDDRERNRLVLTETYRLAAPFEGSAAVRALDVEGEALLGITAMPKTVDRSGPLAFASVPARYRHEVEVEVPGAWRPGFNATRVAHQSAAFAYESDLAPTDAGGRMAYTLDVLATEVAAEDARVHLGELRRVRDDLSTRLAFHAPPAQIGADERKRRLEALLKQSMGDSR